MTDLTTLTWAELMAELARVKAEIARRHLVDSGQREADAANRRWLEAAGVKPCDPWRPPTHALDAYPTGWTVDHGGQCWISTISANMHEPVEGSHCWEPYVEPEPEGAPDPEAEDQS